MSKAQTTEYDRNKAVHELRAKLLKELECVTDLAKLQRINDRVYMHLERMDLETHPGNIKNMYLPLYKAYIHGVDVAARIDRHGKLTPMNIARVTGMDIRLIENVMTQKIPT